MRKVHVEVAEDAGRPEGGYATLLLHGVAGLPDGATFRMKSVEARAGVQLPQSELWPQGERRPMAVRLTEAGVVLLIGPDIVECPALLPGTLGVIEIQAAGIRGEFLWPSIRPTARPRRRNLTVVKPQPARVGASGNAMPATALSMPAARRREAVAESSKSEPDAAPLVVPASEPAVPVTALDHAVPASASIADAVGGNVVSFSQLRESAAAQTAAEASGAATGTPLEAAASGGAAAMVQTEQSAALIRKRWSTQAVAAAASVAVLISGGYLFVRERAAPVKQPELARTEPAALLPRAQAGPRIGESEPAAASPGDVAGVRLENASLPADEPSSSLVAPIVVPDTVAVAPVAPPPSQEVTLRMRGGGFQIAGELKGFDGSKYIISTRAAGVLTMDASRFECIGEGCSRPAATILPLSERPSPVKPDAFRIEGAPALTGEFVPQLIRDYAASIGAAVSELPREGSVSRYRVADVRGTELATIEVVASATSAGLAALERGTAAVALLDRPNAAEAEPRPAPVVRGRSSRVATPTSTEVVVGLDGIAAVAAPGTAVASITMDQLAKVLAGQITDWYELGQAPSPIQLYLPPEGTGTLETIGRQLLRPLGLEFSRTARRMNSEVEAADAVAADPQGLAIVSLAAQRNARAINLETACGFVVRPSAFAIKTEEYPLVRRLSLQFPGQLAFPSAKGLVRLVQSSEVQNAVNAGRLVDQSIVSLPVGLQAERLAWAANAPTSAFDAGELRQMLNDLDGASRLSVTFRFVPGTNDLDARSRREVQRLAAALKEPELAGRRILLAGFTDASGKFQVNMSAAIRRSGQVRAALLSAVGTGFDGRLIQAKGYGPLAPVACGGTREGMRLNRRVEVWVQR